MPPATIARGRRHSTIQFLALAFAVLAVYHGYLYVTGPGRMSDRLRARLAERPAAVDILVIVKFPPEEFHVRLLQQVGTLRGVEASTARLHGVTPANVRYVSRHYWIHRLDLAPN